MSSINGIQRKKVSDLLGYTFGRLTVTSYLGKGKWDKHYWECTCICGGKISLPTATVKRKDGTKSCGCLRKESMALNRACPTRHGLHEHKLYAIYHAMIQRCINPNAQRWKYYGGKGIKVLWEDFLTFYEWAMTNGYRENLSIDRVDPEKDYEPSNCRWITVSENTRRAHLGRFKKSI